MQQKKMLLNDSLYIIVFLRNSLLIRQTKRISNIIAQVYKMKPMDIRNQLDGYETKPSNMNKGCKGTMIVFH